MVERDDVSVEDTPRDAPRELGVDKDVFRARWAAEYAGYMTEAAKLRRPTAMQAEESFQALTNRQAPPSTSPDELVPEERRLRDKARSMSHACALLSLLAIEIALKGWQILDCGQHARDHDLQVLFDSLKTETRAHLEKLGPEVTETLKTHPTGFVSLRYQFEELGNSESVVIPKPSDPLHTAATRIVQDLMEEPRVQQVATHANTLLRSRGRPNTKKKNTQLRKRRRSERG